MPTTYRSILQTQPTDGQIVFMRRFTRDPPVLATWDGTAQQFTLQPGTATLTIVGGTYAGTWPLTYTASLLGSGLEAWYALTGGIYLLAFREHVPNWNLQESDTVNNYHSTDYAPPAGPHTAAAFVTTGAPAWTAPTSMSISALPPTPLIIPAAFVQAWRPQ